MPSVNADDSFHNHIVQQYEVFKSRQNPPDGSSSVFPEGSDAAYPKNDQQSDQKIDQQSDQRIDQKSIINRPKNLIKLVVFLDFSRKNVKKTISAERC